VFQRIVVALDGSEPSERVVPWLRRLVGGADATLHLVTVRPRARAVIVGGRTVAYADQAEDSARLEALVRLRDVAARLAAEGFRVQTDVRFGDPADALIAAARDVEADLIAIATRGIGGLRAFWTRSVAERVVGHSPVPVLITRRAGQRAA
jgi:nucleotide-binding universal stress UspA family protein